MTNSNHRISSWFFPLVGPLWSKHSTKVIVLLLVTALLLYCLQEQIAFTVLSITGSTQPNATEAKNVSNPLTSNVPAFNMNFSSHLKSLSDEISSPLCVFPHINPFDPEIMKMAGLNLSTLSCKSALPDLTLVNGRTLTINKILVSEKYGQRPVRCKYQEIFRTEGDDNNTRFGDFSNHFTDSFDLPEDTEFILVICESDLSIHLTTDPAVNETTKTAAPEWSVVSKRYYPLVPKHRKLSEVESVLLEKRKIEVDPQETLNVLLVGIDGVSRHQFLRAMKRTYNLLMNDFRSYDLTMYTQVGINTFPNYMALLGGKLEYKVTEWWNYKQYADGFDLNWADFKKAGYRTLFSEDQPIIGAFHYEKIGFFNPPTTHFSRPIALAIDRDKSALDAGPNCIGNQPEFMFHAEYVKRFMETFREKPWFAMLFYTKLTHDDFTTLKAIDDHVHDFYASLNVSGLLNNTMVVSFSDHGQRWGSIRSTFNGIIESRTPYAIITLPVWFLEKYPDVAENLNTNSDRLTTHFDTHATIQDLMYFRARGEIPLPKPKHGISLFQEIPKNRTCEEIPIHEEFCVCGQQSLSAIDSSSEISKQLANKVVQGINEKRNPEICDELKLNKILQIAFVKFPDSIVKEKIQKKSMFKVRLQTEPGLAIYEATVYADLRSVTSVGPVFDIAGRSSNVTLSNINVGDSIDRLNFYKGQADCMDDARLKPYCYCKNLTSH